MVGCGEDGLLFYRRGETRLRLNGCGSRTFNFFAMVKSGQTLHALLQKKKKKKKNESLKVLNARVVSNLVSKYTCTNLFKINRKSSPEYLRY